MGCKMNNKQCVTVSCRVNVCKVGEEVDNDLGQVCSKLVDQKNKINCSKSVNQKQGF